MKPEETRVRKVILRMAPLLEKEVRLTANTWLSAEALLYAIAKVESEVGMNNKPREEKAYGPGGKYFVVDQKDRYAIWNERATASYGPWQIMYPTACELGYDEKPWQRSPELLSNPEINCYYVIEFLKRRVFSQHPNQINHIFDSYNSGNFVDGRVPISYIDRAMMAYNNYNRTEVISV